MKKNKSIKRRSSKSKKVKMRRKTGLKKPKIELDLIIYIVIKDINHYICLLLKI